MSTQITVRPSIRPASDLLGEELVRPLDDDLVGLGEPGRGGEDRPRIADGHVVAEERPDPRHGGSEVDGAEDQHPRLRGVRRDEHRHPLTTALTVGSVVERLVAPGREQPAGIGDHRVVGAARPEGPGQQPSS